MLYGTGSGTYSRLGAGTTGQILSVSAGGVPTWVTEVEGITSLNGLTGASQTFANDTNVTITSAGTTHTLGWSGQLSPARGGTGVNNGTSTITLGGNFVTSGANSLTLTTTGATNITLPTSGTLFTNPMTTLGDIIYGGASGAATRLGGSAGLLHSTGAAAPTWSAVSLTADVSGILPTANGGLGANMTAGAIGAIPYSTSTTVYGTLADVAVGSYLRSGGAATAPVWSTLTLPNAATTGDILYGSGANTIGNLTDVAVGRVLTSGGVGAAPAYSATPTLGAVGATGTLSFAGTTSGVVTVQPQAAAGTYNFNLPTTAGTAGQVLTSGGGGAAAMTWTANSGASAQFTPSNPTGNSTGAAGTQLMMGFGGTATITPSKSGKILIIITGSTDQTSSATSGTVGSRIQIHYGTGTAPANQAAAAGTAVGPIHIAINGHPNEQLGFDLNAVVTGLSIGTTYWIDVGLARNTAAGTSNISNIGISAIEN